MPGVRDGDRVRVDDEGEASRLHNKGWYGTPRSGGGLDLDLVEALFLIELGRLEVDDRSFGELLAEGVAVRDGFEIDYLVYRDLRDRGFVVEVEEGYIIYPRGQAPHEATPKARIVPRSERSAFAVDELLADAETAGGDLLYALVDEESDLTYYRVERADLTADEPAPTETVDGDAVLLEDRALLVDPDLGARLHDREFVGRPVHDRLQLSLVETAHLLDRGLTVRTPEGDRLDGDALADRATALQEDFGLRARVYAALRERGLVVKTGFKYGAHFRVYRGDPQDSHAELLVHALPAGFEGAWPETAGFVRLAHSVRKTMVFVTPRETGLDAVALQRARP